MPFVRGLLILVGSTLTFASLGFLVGTRYAVNPDEHAVYSGIALGVGIGVLMISILAHLRPRAD